MKRVYLDYAASAPMRPEAKAKMAELLDVFGNPSSIHAEGQAARVVMDETRRLVAEALGVRAERVVFTSGGTEANNLCLRGFKAANAGKTVLVSAVEHDCVRNTGKSVGAEEIPVDKQGVVQLDWLEARLKRGDVGLVSVMHANNESGALQPIEEIAKIAHELGGFLHTDAVQTVGHRPVDVDALGVDFLSFSAHKFGGPKGVGALVLKSEIAMEAVLTGGGQERNRRAGTENVLGVGGMGAALLAALENMEKERAAAAQFGAEVVRCVGGDGRYKIVAEAAERVEHVVQVIMPGKRGDDTVIAMDLKGIAISQGSACGSGRVKESHVLRAMGYGDEAGQAVRLSWGWNTTEADIAAGLGALLS